MTLSGKRILLIIGGGIAAYKSLELVRRIQDRGGRVRAILTGAGGQFITPLSVSSLTGEKCYTDLFSLTDEAEMGHIRLSREADLVVVAPATADLIAKVANGLADDLASTALLATDKPVLLAPAMNVEMWAKPSTQRNLATVTSDGARRVGPGDGDLACGEVGSGRMAEVSDILGAIEDILVSAPRPLAGRKAIVTAGSTREAIDPIRYIANRSSGKQGYAVASALAGLGAETVLVSGPTELDTPAGVQRIDVESATDMMAAVLAELPADIAVCVAAVADWRAEDVSPAKIKKNGSKPPKLTLTENPDILKTIAGRGNDRPQLVVGFAAETDSVIDNAREKRKRKGCDWIVANDVSAGSGVMGGDENSVHLISETETQAWERASKTEIGRRLAARIATALGESAP